MVVPKTADRRQHWVVYSAHSTSVLFNTRGLEHFGIYLVFIIEAHDLAARGLVVLKTADRRQHWACTLVLTATHVLQGKHLQ
jgi:hypothetical protein